MTDDRHVVFAEFVFTGQERPAQLRLGAKHLEVAGGNECASQLDRFRATGQRDGIARLRRHEVEDGVVSLPVEEVQRGDAVARAPGRLLHDPDDAIGVGIGEWLQQHRIDEAEDGGIGADADGQCQDRDGRKSWALPQCTNRVTKLLQPQRHETHLHRDAMALASWTGL
jgi:hypothetical protein